MNAWAGGSAPDFRHRNLLGFFRIMIRFVLMIFTIYGLLMIFWIIRLFEFPWGRIYSPKITRIVCMLCLRILGIRQTIIGAPMDKPGAVVSNHTSWLDIFTLNAPQEIFFIAKQEIKSWFGIAVLAKSTGSVFIERNPLRASQHSEILGDRLKKGDKLLFFPEGTSTDGQLVLPFKSTLFAPFFLQDLTQRLWIQSISVRYFSPNGEDPRHYAWWGEILMAPHLLRVLSAPGRGHVVVEFHKPVKVNKFENRKQLALFCEDQVRAGFDNFGHQFNRLNDNST